METVVENKVKVTLCGREPSGLAMILAQYFEQNIKDFESKNTQARLTRGKLSIEAVEGSVAVTVDFKGNEIDISEGCDPVADMLVRGGIFALTQLAAGGTGAIGKIIRGDLEIDSAWKHPVFALRVARFMSLPNELKSNDAGPAAYPLLWKLSALAAFGAAIGLAVYFLSN